MMKLGAGGGGAVGFRGGVPFGTGPVTARVAPADMETCVGSPPAPGLVRRRRCFGFRNREPAKDLLLYSPDEGALGATGACRALQGIAETVSAGPGSSRDPATGRCVQAARFLLAH